MKRLQVEQFHFHCHPHVPSCMCANHLDGWIHYVCCCYTGINLGGKLFNWKSYFTSWTHFHFHPHVPSCMCANHCMDGFLLLCLLCYTGINLVHVSYIIEKVILQVEQFHFHCHPHVPSCMCANHYLDGYWLCLLCYTGINLACKLHNWKSYFTSWMISLSLSSSCSILHVCKLLHGWISIMSALLYWDQSSV